MCFFGLVETLSSSQTSALLIGLLALVIASVWIVCRYVSDRPASPDPWDEATSAALESENATALCHRCLTPHEAETEFCATCGAPVGQYTNWLPYPYLFSIGHTLRLGTDNNFKRSPATVFGFLLLAVAEYGILAPVYWVRLLDAISYRPFPDEESPTIEPPPTSLH